MSGPTDFLFRRDDVPTQTTDRVREALNVGKSCLVAGRVGSGKSHAVRKAVNGAVWVDVDDGPLRFPRFFCDAARQLGSGSSILEAVASGEPEVSWAALDHALDGNVLVVDNVERLVSSVGG